MRILVLGSGGRENALAWRLRLDEGVESVTVTDKVDDNSRHFDLVVIGPEKYLFDGTSDRLQEAGVPVFGPSQAASFLEGSKMRAKQFMRTHQVPTSAFHVVRTLDEGLEVLKNNSHWFGYVLKLSGPSLGKGVIVARDLQDAHEALSNFFEHHPPGIEDGIVIEEKVKGKEVSLFYLCANEEFRFVASACDHKRLLDGDLGPNTGGMGAFSPCSFVDDAFLSRVEAEIVRPTLRGMKEQNTPFSGMLFLGLMVDQTSPGGKISLLEYNTRFGDPETQTFLPLLKGNLTQALLACARTDGRRLKEVSLSLAPQFSVHVVKAARGYPGIFGEKVESHQKIHFKRELDSDTHLFLAGVVQKNDEIYTAGGRILGITALDANMQNARKKAYENLSFVTFTGEQFRTDIGGSL